MKTFRTSLLLAALLVLPAVSQATAPSVVEPTYDGAAKTLSVKIRHWSLSDYMHYIKFVVVKVNGNQVMENKYDRQPDTEYTYTYNLAANPGDVIEVTAKCNLWGSKTISITLPGAPAAAAPAAPADAGAKPADAPKEEPAK